MKTDFREHFIWAVGLSCLIAFFTKIHPFNLYNLIVLSQFVAGGCFPDLDLSLNLTRWPKVKRTTLSLLSLVPIAFISHSLYVGLGLDSVWQVKNIFFLAWPLLPLVLLVTQRLHLLSIVGIHHDAQHRDSVFHSSIFWLLFALLPLAPDVITDHHNHDLAMNLKFSLSLGCLAHIFLDYIGSVHENISRKNAVLLCKATMAIVLLCLLLLKPTQCLVWLNEIVKLTMSTVYKLRAYWITD